MIPKLRYRAGRLVYLGSNEVLKELSEPTMGMPELHLHGEVMWAVGSRRVDRLLPLGSNAAQAAAQPLAATGQSVLLASLELDATARQSLAILLLNGVKVEGSPDMLFIDDKLIQFARSGSDPEMMRSAEPFLRELACLHGLESGPRHQQMLHTAFDQDDSLVMDAIDQLQESASP